MRLHKFLSKKVGALLISLMLIITGCSSQDSNSSKTNSKETPVVFWYMGDGKDGIQAMIDQFTEESGIPVEIQSIPWSSSHDKLLTAVASGQGPDVVQMGSTFMAEFAEAGALVDITDHIENNEYLKSSNFFEGAVNTSIIKGKHYGIPWYTETRVLYYRTDLLKTVGYEEAPKTWDELLDAATKLAARGENYYGFDIGSKEQTFGFMLGRQNGSPVFNKNGQPVFNQPAFVESVEYQDQFIKNKAAPGIDLNLDISQTFGGDGMVPMFVSGPWMMYEIQKNIPDMPSENWGIALLPKGPVNGTSSTGGASLSIFSSSKNQENALKLMEFLSKPANQIEYYKTTQSLPANLQAWENKIFDDPKIAVFGEQLKDSEPMPAYKEFEAIAKAYLNEWEQIYMTGKDVQAAMDDLNVKVEKILGQ